MRQSANNTNNKQIETTIWNKDLKEGDKLEGVYKYSGVVTTKYGEANRYVIVDGLGNGWAIFGTASIDRQFKKIPEGSYVWVEYKGTEVSKNGFNVKVFEIDFDDEYQG